MGSTVVQGRPVADAASVELRRDWLRSAEWGHGQSAGPECPWRPRVPCRRESQLEDSKLEDRLGVVLF